MSLVFHAGLEAETAIQLFNQLGKLTTPWGLVHAGNGNFDLFIDGAPTQHKLQLNATGKWLLITTLTLED